MSGDGHVLIAIWRAISILHGCRYQRNVIKPPLSKARRTYEQERIADQPLPKSSHQPCLRLSPSRSTILSSRFRRRSAEAMGDAVDVDFDTVAYTTIYEAVADAKVSGDDAGNDRLEWLSVVGHHVLMSLFLLFTSLDRVDAYAQL